MPDRFHAALGPAQEHRGPKHPHRVAGWAGPAETSSVEGNVSLLATTCVGVIMGYDLVVFSQLNKIFKLFNLKLYSIRLIIFAFLGWGTKTNDADKITKMHL